MIRTTCILRGLGLAAAAMMAGPVLAADDRVPQSPGLHGSVLLGGGYMDLESNLVAGNSLIDVGVPTVASVDQGPASSDATFAVVRGELAYAFGNGWEVFLGGSTEDYVTLDFSSRLGMRKQADGIGVVGASLVTSGVVPSEVWADPYLSGSPRSTTDREFSGVRLDWWRILDSGFFAQIQTRKIDIKDELSGTDPSLGLTDEQIRLLRRDGDNSRFTLGYRWQSGRHVWQPEISAGADDRDGSALSGDVVGFQLSYSYFGEDWTLVGSGLVSQKSHDEANPVYGRKTDADTYAVSFTAFRKLGLGDGDWRALGTLIYGDSNSDVDFHDSTAFGATLGVAYFFGR